MHTPPRHVAIIMDGNGRWAEARGKPRLFGHEAGAEAVRRTLRAARRHGVEFLTLYAFSIENWSRSEIEVKGLMRLLESFLKKNERELHENKVRLRVLGRREDLPKSVNARLTQVEAATAGYPEATLILALSYGGRTEITHAVRTLARAAKEGRIDPETIDEAAVANALYLPDVPDPDLIIRTSGEIRLSNFLLWQAAYSEFCFLEKMWPDFTEADFDAACADFEKRERRFGGIDTASPTTNHT